MEKKCESCGAFFRKPPKKGYADWEERRFCSRGCFLKSFRGAGHHQWKGGQRELSCKICTKSFKVDQYNKTAKFCSIPCLNEFRKSKEWRNHLSEIQKKRVKQGLHNSYRGGVASQNKIIRRSVEFKLWREAVFKRDDYTCQECGDRGNELHPDHIKQFAYYPELRFEISNGRTLCAECHRRTPTWGKRQKLII